jgi:hypothetical protein
MLFRVDTQQRTAAQVPATTLAALRLWERQDLQEWVLHTPKLLGEDLLVITSEFDRFDRTSERLDLLALDRRGKLVVVELKRSAMGTAAELQALRYAAFCSNMSLQDVAELHRSFLQSRGRPEASLEEAMGAIQSFIEEPGYSGPDNKPRIILAAEEFPPEITSTVLWLRSFEVDVTCVRLRPHLIEGQVIIDSSVLIPLPEAEEFLIRRERKESEQTSRGDRRPIDPAEYLAAVPEPIRPAFQRVRDWLVSREGIGETAFRSGLTYKRASDQAWVTWLEHTRNEVRVALPPNVALDPSRIVRRSRGGWLIVSARTDEEAAEVVLLLAEAVADLNGHV